jgi:hypothetical protein
MIALQVSYGKDKKISAPSDKANGKDRPETDARINKTYLNLIRVGQRLVKNFFAWS